MVAQYTQPIQDWGEAFARIEYFHIGRFYYDATNLASERYDLLNIRVGGGGKKWRVEGFIENVTDEDYIPVAFQIDPQGLGPLRAIPLSVRAANQWAPWPSRMDAICSPSAHATSNE